MKTITFEECAKLEVKELLMLAKTFNKLSDHETEAVIDEFLLQKFEKADFGSVEGESLRNELEGCRDMVAEYNSLRSSLGMAAAGRLGTLIAKLSNKDLSGSERVNLEHAFRIASHIQEKLQIKS